MFKSGNFYSDFDSRHLKLGGCPLDVSDHSHFNFRGGDLKKLLLTSFSPNVPDKVLEFCYFSDLYLKREGSIEFFYRFAEYSAQNYSLGDLNCDEINMFFEDLFHCNEPTTEELLARFKHYFSCSPKFGLFFDLFFDHFKKFKVFYLSNTSNRSSLNFIIDEEKIACPGFFHFDGEGLSDFYTLIRHRFSQSCAAGYPLSQMSIESSHQSILDSLECLGNIEHCIKLKDDDSILSHFLDALILSKDVFSDFYLDDSFRERDYKIKNGNLWDTKSLFTCSSRTVEISDFSTINFSSDNLYYFIKRSFDEEYANYLFNIFHEVDKLNFFDIKYKEWLHATPKKEFKSCYGGALIYFLEKVYCTSESELINQFKSISLMGGEHVIKSFVDLILFLADDFLKPVDLSRFIDATCKFDGLDLNDEGFDTLVKKFHSCILNEKDAIKVFGNEISENTMRLQWLFEDLLNMSSLNFNDDKFVLTLIKIMKEYSIYFGENNIHKHLKNRLKHG